MSEGKWVERAGRLVLLDDQGNVLAQQKLKRTPKSITNGPGRGRPTKEMLEARARGVQVIRKELEPFDPIVADQVVDALLDGAKITQLPEGLPPYRVLWKWQQENPDFKRKCQEAKKAKAEIMADLALETAENTFTEDEVPAARLKVDTYKWVAQTADPNTYGTKTTVRGDPSAPLGFLVSTGIIRDEEPEAPAIETVGKPLPSPGPEESQ